MMPTTKTHEEPKSVAKWLPPMALFVTVGWLAYLWVAGPPHPPVGTYIGVLAFIAAIVSVWPPENRWARATWLLIFGAFLVLEISTLYRQREEDEATARQNKIDEDDRFTKLLRTEHEEFAKILDQNQKSFDRTMDRFEGLARLSRENVDAVTGGSGFPLIDIIGAPVDKDGLSLLAVVHGKHALRDVTYELTEGRPPYIPNAQEMNDILAGRTSSVSLGNLTPTTGRLMGRVLHPSIKEGGYYNINLFALNGPVNEKLEVRMEKDGTWNREITVMRGNKIVFRSHWNPAARL